MQNHYTIKIGQRGVVTLPQSLRKSHELTVGKELTIIDLGGVFVLSPKESRVDALADRLAGDLKAQGESLESLLSTVRDARARYDA